MSENALGEATELRIDRVVDAPIEEVFAAWTTPSQMTWMSAVGEAEVEADVRPGGRFTVVMVGDGRRIEHTGEYLAVDPPRRLEFTWVSPFTGSEPSVVSVDLTPAGGGTRLVLTHRQLPTDEVANHRTGWGRILDRLPAALRA
jgi:uncharacterized protein YndB with AHSA1/START domain